MNTSCNNEPFSGQPSADHQDLVTTDAGNENTLRVPRILLLHKFGQELIGQYVSSTLLPLLSEHGEVRVVDRASDEPHEQRYWISVIVRLAFEADLVVIVENGKGPNVRWVEEHILTKMTFGDFPLARLVTTEASLQRLLQPSLVMVTFTRRALRKARLQVIHHGDLVTWVDCDLSIPDLVRPGLKTVIDRAIDCRTSRLIELFSSSRAVFDLYWDIALAIDNDPEVLESISVFGARDNDVTRVPFSGLASAELYRAVCSAIASTGIFSVYHETVSLLAKVDRYRLFTRRDISRLQASWATYAQRSPSIQAFDNNFASHMSRFMAVILLILWITKLLLFPLKMIRALLRRI